MTRLSYKYIKRYASDLMKKLYRYLKFHFKMACKNIVRHFGLTFSASCAVSVTLILISVFMLITMNLNHFTQNIQQQVTIRSSIDTIVTEEEQKQLQEQIEALDTVKTVTLSTGDEELEKFKDEYKDDASLFEMYEGDNNPIRDTFIVEIKNGESIEQTASAIEGMKGIVSAEYGGETTSSMMTTFSTIREGSLIFIIFLVVIAILLISNKIKMSIYTRKQEIAIMRFIGASNWSIKFPMMLEGIFIGILGSIVPVLLTIFGYQFIYDNLEGSFMSSMFVLQDVFPLTLEISIVLICISIIVGLVGSFFSTTRYLRWKR